jgi:single-stranded DNA-binding protein
MSGIEAAFFGALGRDAESKVSKWVNVTAFDDKAIAASDKFLKGARVYIEGRLSLDEWTAQDGAKRTSLSCLSWHFRLAQIGRNKPKRQRDSSEAAPAQVGGDFGDEIPF